MEQTVNWNNHKEPENNDALISQLDADRGLRIVGPSQKKHDGKPEVKPEHILAKRLLTKNSRKSRKPMGKNRGNPKKGGAGSKTVWGKAGCELYGTSAALDDGDPNYDSENQDDSFLESEPRVVSEEEFNRQVKIILNEYFQSGDVAEVVDQLRELENTRDFANCIHLMVSRALVMALEHRPSHRELVSALLADCCAAGVLVPELVAVGFSAVLNDLSDLIVDVPDAVETIGRFIARAVADNCLPESFVKRLLENNDQGHISDAAKVAQGLLADRRMVFRLDGIWISTARHCSESLSESNDAFRCPDSSNEATTIGGLSPRSRARYDSGSGTTYYPRPVLLLTHELEAILKEYLAAGDCEEFVRQLKAMDVPHFHHELVYELLLMLINENRDTAMDAFLKLVARLVSDNTVTEGQIIQAYRRIAADFEEIEIDCPLAQFWTERFATAAIQRNIHNSNVFDSLPLKGRKRFCSEGDGGQLKN